MSSSFESYYLFFLVRHKVKELLEFIQDDDRIRNERKKAKANRDKYVGMSNESSYHRYSNYLFFSFFIYNSFFIIQMITMK